MKILLKILKYVLYMTPLVIVLIVAIRLVSSGDPQESGNILNTYAFESAYQNLGGDFLMYKIRVKDNFEIGDALCVLDVLYLESSHDLQLTLRGKKNRFEEICSVLDLTSVNYADLLKLYLRVTTKIPADNSDEIPQETFVADIFEISESYLFENERYEYIRVNFSDIYVDYAKTKLELFIFDKLREFSPEDLDNSHYIARFTLFDINMPKEKVKADKFEVLK